MSNNQKAKNIEDALNLLPDVTATISCSEALAQVTSLDGQTAGQMNEIATSKGYDARPVKDYICIGIWAWMHQNI